MSDNPFIKLAAVDVSKHIEKKQNLSYLSWPFAIDQLMRHDPSANWEFHAPEMYGETMMISCTVTAFGKPIKMHLPVMDHRNQAIKNPNAFEVNKNMMRCLVKAIACHGLGLFIYAGEDLPLDDDGNVVQKQRPVAKTEAKAEVKTEAPKVAEKPPGNIAGKDEPWQIKITTTPEADMAAFIDMVFDATNKMLEFAKTEKNVMDIFKVNRVIFDKVKAADASIYNELMDSFKTTKAKLQ